jgi:nucleoside-diphosphate-sugar epimerase
MASVKVLLLGGTGFVGGTILTELFATPQRLFHSERRPSNLHLAITCVVRSSTTARQLEEAYPPAQIEGPSGVHIRVLLETVIGSLASTDLLTKLASDQDVVIQCADCDHAVGIQALLDGVAAAPRKDDRPTPNGRPVMLHTSGARNVVDLAVPLGDLDSTIVADDLDGTCPPLKLPKDRSHAELEQALATRADENGAQFAILSPAGIHGQGTGRVGKQETYPNLWYKAIIENGEVFVVGRGQNVYSFSSVKDVAGAIIWALGESISVGQDVDSGCRLCWGTKGYYYVESFEVVAIDRAKALGKRLIAKGKLPSDNVHSMTAEEARSRFGAFVPMVAGVNMRCRGNRLKKLGWRPSDMNWEEMASEGTGERL